MQVSKKYSIKTFEHVPPIAACHRVEGQGTGWSVQGLCAQFQRQRAVLKGNPIWAALDLDSY